MSEKPRDTVTDEPFDPTKLPIQVCMSAAGYYIGQLEPCGVPYSRLSGYYSTYEEAEKELELGWQSRGADENKELEDQLEDKGVIERRPLN